MSRRLIKTPQMEEDVLYMYWVMLANLTYSVAKDDFLGKHEIEAAYAVWNRVNGTNLKPYWRDLTPEKTENQFPN